jgi:hypothetical protein
VRNIVSESLAYLKFFMARQHGVFAVLRTCHFSTVCCLTQIIFWALATDQNIREYVIKVEVNGFLHKVLVVHNTSERPAVDTALISDSALKYCTLHKLDTSSPSCITIHNAVIANARGETADDVSSINRPRVLDRDQDNLQTSSISRNSPPPSLPLFELHLEPDAGPHAPAIDGPVVVRDAPAIARPDDIVRELCAACAPAAGCDPAQCAARARDRLLNVRPPPPSPPRRSPAGWTVQAGSALRE